MFADHRTVMRRIMERGRAYELNMDPAYIEQLSGAYHEFFRGWKRCPVLSVDTRRIDFRTGSPALEQLVKMIELGSDPVALTPTRDDDPNRRFSF